MSDYVAKVVTGKIFFPPEEFNVFTTPVHADAIPLTVEALTSIGAHIPRYGEGLMIHLYLYGVTSTGALEPIVLSETDDTESLNMAVYHYLTGEHAADMPVTIWVAGDLGAEPPTGVAGRIAIASSAPLALLPGRYRFDIVQSFFDELGEVIGKMTIMGGWLDVLPAVPVAPL